MKVSQATLLAKIQMRVTRLADQVYSPDEAADSDGLDQAEAGGLLQALAIVEEEFSKNQVMPT